MREDYWKGKYVCGDQGNVGILLKVNKIFPFNFIIIYFVLKYNNSYS